MDSLDTLDHQTQSIIVALEGFLMNMVSGLVENPKMVIIDPSVDDRGIFFKIQVAKSDMGKVIGKEGDTVRAMRTILHAAGGGHDVKASLQIVEPQ